MFESVVLRRSEISKSVSVGDIAQSLLFYQKAHIVLDGGILASLIQKLGFGNTLTLFGRHDISAVYADEMLAVMTNGYGGFASHDFHEITILGQDDKKSLSIEERITLELERHGIAKQEARKFVTQLLKKVPVRKLSGNHFIKGGICEAIRNEFTNRTFLEQAVKIALGSIANKYSAPEPLKFDIIKTDLGHFYFNNIDFEKINELHPVPAGGSAINIASLLSTMQHAISDLILASHYGGDYVTTRLASDFSRIRHRELLNRSQKNADMQSDFAEIVLPDMPTISEVIDSGERSFDEFMKLLDKAEKFKKWVGAANPDVGLVQEYMNSITTQDWIQTTQAKSLRYLISTFVDGFIPSPVGAAGFFDNFLLEKITGGWRPNHFVEGRLKPFLGG